ncbi:MAG: glycosyltransferase family 2 protein [Halieaceae bacterium]
MESAQGLSAVDGAVRVSVSMVTFNSSFSLLRKTLDGLERAVRYATEQHLPLSVQLLVVDNSTDTGYQERVRQLLLEDSAYGFDTVEVWHPGSNIGYGAAHNRALDRADSDFHLILNPDVELAQDAIYSGLDYMGRHEDIAIVSPRATNARGQVQYLCKRYPSILVLSLRGFAPAFIQSWFRPYLESYEIRDSLSESSVTDVPLVSGCCMCARTDALRGVGGFSDKFFMYFEDFDLSMRLQPMGRLVYLSSMHIVHHGGYSARKGWRHISMFVQSGWKFFQRHGWCWI